MEHLAGSPRLMRAILLIAIGGDGDLDEAARTLDELESACTEVNNTLSLIGVQAVCGLLHQARGDHEAAL
ncbi:hypothetical protein RSW84_25430, partial [Escherichia coli]|nr:hypothetical protein [Escherichia coli]